ncbi:MAG: hypothetical protein HKO66_03100 [Saprospiraceae bacterium]|nr:hypothetical protein [Bacteroidia bacterium]NNE16237.1 hypothetical protein [Saprospiraceae bacterium]NNL91201.1 hypothetical protein [Saprospiraceae bacterium]
MNINEIRQHLSEAETIAFELPNGSLVPSHFHVTEVGKVVKDFIDCGGTVRHEEVANFQLWEADDYDHRLHPDKLIDIIELSQNKLGIGNLNIEVEYQGETIGKYDLDHNGNHFVLVSKTTDCLARDKCGIPQEKPKFNLADLTSNNSCAPGSGCC